MRPEIEDAIRTVINRYSAENGSDTPDFILAQYMLACLEAFNAATKERERWYGRGPEPASEDASRALGKGE